MVDDYILRRDVDNLKKDVYDLDDGNLNFAPFATDSNLRNIGSTADNIGTLDGILEYYGVFEGSGGGGGGGDLSNYYTKPEINTILSSYATIGFANSQYALKTHTHSQYITRAEISDLDINLTTLELVPYEDNQNGVMCFDRVQKTIDELDIGLSVDTLSNGYLKIEVDLIEVTRSVNNGNSS